MCDVACLGGMLCLNLIKAQLSTVCLLCTIAHYVGACHTISQVRCSTTAAAEQLLAVAQRVMTKYWTQRQAGASLQWLHSAQEQSTPLEHLPEHAFCTGFIPLWRAKRKYVSDAVGQVRF